MHDLCLFATLSRLKAIKKLPLFQKHLTAPDKWEKLPMTKWQSSGLQAKMSRTFAAKGNEKHFDKSEIYRTKVRDLPAKCLFLILVDTFFVLYLHQ
jgi:hypothetical protein